MKRIVLTLGLLAAVNCAAMADGNAFTPLNFNDTQYGSTTTTTTSTKSAPAASSAEGDAVGNGNIQNAILQLDNAQVVSSEFVCKTEAHRCSSSLNNKKEGIRPLFYYSIFFLIFSFALSISLILFSIVETCFFRAFLSVLTSLY